MVIPMIFNKQNEAVINAVAIIENLIEVTEKNNENEMAEQLKEARRILLFSGKGKSIDVETIKNIIALICYIARLF